MERFFTSRWFNPSAALLIALLTIAIYYPSFDASFQFDDFNVLMQGSAIASPSNFIGIITGARGVSMLTFTINHAISGADPGAYHITNIALHIACSIAAYVFVLLTIGLTGISAARARLISLAAALLFAIHPVQTSTVSYVIQRMEILASLFYLLSLIAFIRALKTEGKIKWGWYFLTVLLYAIAFQSKESAITLPAIALLVDYFFFSKGNIKDAAKRLPVYAVLTLMCVFFTINTFNNLSRSSAAVGGEDKKAAALYSAAMQGNRSALTQVPGIKAQEHAVSAGFGLKTITAREYLYTQFNVVLYYIALLAIPANQNIDYDFPVSSGLFDSPASKPGTALNYPIPPPIVSLVVLLGIITAAVLLYIFRRSSGSIRATASFFIFWFFIVVSPTSSVVPITDVIFEHRVYLASLGFFVIIFISADALIDLSFNRISGRGNRN